MESGPCSNIGAKKSLAAALDDNAALMSLVLGCNRVGAQGARALAAALDKVATLTLYLNNADGWLTPGGAYITAAAAASAASAAASASSPRLCSYE